LRIQATVATGVERKKEVTNNSAGKSRLLTPGQFLLDRLTQDIGVRSYGRAGIGARCVQPFQKIHARKGA
jgi:hypothetical protein